MEEIKKGGEEFFTKKKLGGRGLFSVKIRGEGEGFFRLKKGGEDFFSDKFFPKPGLGTR